MREEDILKNQDRFFKALEDIFVGVPIEGQGGFVNLLKIKANYYEKIKQAIIDEVEATGYDGEQQDDIYEKLYSFFINYFSPSGSVYYTGTAMDKDIYTEVYRAQPDKSKDDKVNNPYKILGKTRYERIYSAEDDVSLFWKTDNLHYVKTDNLFREMCITVNDSQFHFDVEKLKSNGTNQKKELLLTVSKVSRDDRIIYFEVSHKNTNGNGNGNGEDENDDNGNGKNPFTEIIKEIKKQGIDYPPSEAEISKALEIFKKQTICDFFINKNAQKFLEEQFRMWYFQYLWSYSEGWEEERIAQMHKLKEIAESIIKFFSQFEDELVRIWNKPKFVRNSNYVISMDRIEDASITKKIKQHKGYKLQQKEWKELGISDSKNAERNPIDTKYFKDLELEILATQTKKGKHDNLDDALDGWLIKSENYQALNTILPKFESKVQCVYIDPPFNTGEDFSYLDSFQDSTWLSMMHERIVLGREFMSDSAYIYLHLDHYADYLGRMLMKKIFYESGVESQAFITWNTGDNISGYKTQRDNWIRQADKIFCFPKKADLAKFTKLWNPVKDQANKKIGWLDFIGEDKKNLYIETWKDGVVVKEKVNVKSKRIGTIWNDVYSFQYSEPRETESFSFQTQKPENLLRRIIQSGTEPGQMVLDFFSGIGTTAAAAHKLGRRWIAVEMGEHFDNFYSDDGIKKLGLLGRMKLIINGDKNFTLPNTKEIRRPHLTKDINWQGGGFFKYYELESYEETLDKCRTSIPDLLIQNNKSIYEQYVFFGGKKLLDAVKVDRKKKEVKVDLSRLYDNIDLAETLSNLKGVNIKSVTKDEVIFSDGSKENLTDVNPQTIKPLIWWDED